MVEIRKCELKNENRILTFRMQICSIRKSKHKNMNCYSSDEDIEICMDALDEQSEMYQKR